LQDSRCWWAKYYKEAASFAYGHREEAERKEAWKELHPGFGSASTFGCFNLNQVLQMTILEERSPLYLEGAMYQIETGRYQGALN
jgi:hypothetical protein